MELVDQVVEDIETFLGRAGWWLDLLVRVESMSNGGGFPRRNGEGLWLVAGGLGEDDDSFTYLVEAL